MNDSQRERLQDMQKMVKEIYEGIIKIRGELDDMDTTDQCELERVDEVDNRLYKVEVRLFSAQKYLDDAVRM